MNKNLLKGLTLANVDYSNGAVWFTLTGANADICVMSDNITLRLKTTTMIGIKAYHNDEAIRRLDPETAVDILNLQKLLK